MNVSGFTQLLNVAADTPLKEEERAALLAALIS